MTDVDKLIEILRRRTALKSERKTVREIGERINKEGGFSAMVDTCMQIRKRFPNGEGGENGWHPAEIEAAWDGIGDFRW